MSLVVRLMPTAVKDWISVEWFKQTCTIDCNVCHTRSESRRDCRVACLSGQGVSDVITLVITISGCKHENYIRESLVSTIGIAIS